MKTLISRTISLLLVLTLCFGTGVLADAEGEFFSLHANSPECMLLRIRAKDIRHSEKNITFRSHAEADSSIYIIDKYTVYEDDAALAEKGLEAFRHSENPEITVYIPKCQYYLFRQKENAEVSVVAVPSFSKEISAPLPDAENPFAVLNAFSIADKNADLTAPVSRGEMAKMLVMTRRISDYAGPFESTFADVPPSHPHYSLIHIAKAIGIVNGYEDHTFRPDEIISAKECIKTVVALLGYSPLAEARGGYPNGYIMVSSQIGLTKGISLDLSAPVTLSTALQLLKNALYLPNMVQSVYKQDAAEYDVADGTNGKPYLRFYDRYYTY